MYVGIILRIFGFGPGTAEVKGLPGNCPIVRHSVPLVSIIFQKAVKHSYEALNNGSLCPLLWYTVTITSWRWIGFGVLVS